MKFVLAPQGLEAHLYHFLILTEHQRRKIEKVSVHQHSLNGSSVVLQVQVLYQKHSLELLLWAAPACGNTVDEVARAQNQDSEEDIEAGHKDFGRQCIFC